MLYMRMLLIMAVTLYTSRIILNTHGVEDFGIYNVVGGVISMLGFLNSSLGGASSRFITFSLGKNDKKELRKVFSTVVFIHLILAVVIILLGETLGLWFVYHKLVIPPERLTAALWVYHCSILTAVVSIISVPYNSLVVAHERMSAFAYISVIEVALKLGIVYFLVYISQDKLITYAVLYLIVQIFIRFLYGCYCSSHFSESKILFGWSPQLVKEISIYAGWTVNGNLAVVGYTQGINILLNLFFGPVANAARGIAVQVQAAVMTFMQNMQMAVRPQIIKSYATFDLSYMHTLVVASSKYGFFLMLVLTFPIMLCVDPILKIWLGVVPGYTVGFVRIMLMIGLLESLKVALISAIHATGDIRKFQIYEGTFLLTVVPIAYVLLKVYHISPNDVMLVYFFVELVTQCIRVWIVCPRIQMPFTSYLKKIICPILPPLLCILPVLSWLSLPKELSLGCLALYLSLAVLYVLICIYLLGLTSSERRIMYNFVKTNINCILNFLRV